MHCVNSKHIDWHVKLRLVQALLLYNLVWLTIFDQLIVLLPLCWKGCQWIQLHSLSPAIGVWIQWTAQSPKSQEVPQISSGLGQISTKWYEHVINSLNEQFKNQLLVFTKFSLPLSRAPVLTCIQCYGLNISYFLTGTVGSKVFQCCYVIYMYESSGIYTVGLR